MKTRVAALFLTGLLSVAPRLPAQVVIVERNVNLRPDPSSAHDALRKLEPPEVAALLDPDKTNGYYNVRTVEGLQGWVWGNNVDVDLTQGFDVDPPYADAIAEQRPDTIRVTTESGDKIMLYHVTADDFTIVGSEQRESAEARGSATAWSERHTVAVPMTDVQEVAVRKSDTTANFGLGFAIAAGALAVTAGILILGLYCSPSYRC